MSKNSPILLLFCVLASFSSALEAKSTNYTKVEAIAGKPVQLTYHASAHKSTCMPAPPPKINVIEAPKAGLLIVRKAVLTTEKISGCPHLRTLAQVVFYRARDGYVGPDHVSYEVKSADGNDELYDVTITVKAAPAPSGAPGRSL